MSPKTAWAVQRVQVVEAQGRRRAISASWLWDRVSAVGQWRANRAWRVGGHLRVVVERVLRVLGAGQALPVRDIGGVSMLCCVIWPFCNEKRALMEMTGCTYRFPKKTVCLFESSTIVYISGIYQGKSSPIGGEFAFVSMIKQEFEFRFRFRQPGSFYVEVNEGGCCLFIDD